jgi:hypothetical protein
MHQHLPRRNMVAVMDQYVPDDASFEVCDGPVMGFHADFTRGHSGALDWRECGPTPKPTK